MDCIEYLEECAERLGETERWLRRISVPSLPPAGRKAHARALAATTRSLAACAELQSLLRAPTTIAATRLVVDVCRDFRDAVSIPEHVASIARAVPAIRTDPMAAQALADPVRNVVGALRSRLGYQFLRDRLDAVERSAAWQQIMLGTREAADVATCLELLCASARTSRQRSERMVTVAGAYGHVMALDWILAEIERGGPAPDGRAAIVALRGHLAPIANAHEVMLRLAPSGT